MKKIIKSRRDFLSFVAGSAFAAVSGMKPASAAHGEHLPQSIPLPFVDISGLGPNQEGPYVQDTYCPLHKEKIIDPRAVPEKQHRAAEQFLKQEFAHQGLDWPDSFTTVWTSQHYGVPDDSGYSGALLVYCEQVQNYLYANLTGLFPQKPAWSLLTPDNCPERVGESFQAFVGRFTYLIIRVKVSDASNIIHGPCLINARPLERSLNFISSDAASYIPKKSVIYIIPGLTALCSPFSELLHTSSNEAALRYANELENNTDAASAREQARIFVETITEAISITMTRQYLQTHKYLKRLEQLGVLAQHMYNYLPDLDTALAYCHEYGPQACFDEFKANPGLLKKRMEKYRDQW